MAFSHEPFAKSLTSVSATYLSLARVEAVEGAILVLTAEHGAVCPPTLLRSYFAGTETWQQTDLAELSFAQASSKRRVRNKSGKSASDEEKNKEVYAAHGEVSTPPEVCY